MSEGNIVLLTQLHLLDSLTGPHIFNDKSLGQRQKPNNGPPVTIMLLLIDWLIDWSHLFTMESWCILSVLQPVYELPEPDGLD